MRENNMMPNAEKADTRKAAGNVCRHTESGYQSRTKILCQYGKSDGMRYRPRRLAETTVIVKATSRAIIPRSALITSVQVAVLARLVAAALGMARLVHVLTSRR